MKNTKIVATGSYLPKSVVTNQDLEKFIETTDSWIQERTGISQRHIVAPGQDSCDMAVKACQDMNIDLADVSLLIVATCTPTKLMPSVACRVQAELGLKNIPALDINAACSGFIYALATADSYIKSGLASKVLVVGTDSMSNIVDWEDRSTCVLFGDGAGAVLLEETDSEGVITTKLGASGELGDLLTTGGNILSAAEPPFISMKGKEVFRKAVNNMAQVAADVLAQSGLATTDIDWLIPHQANRRIIESTAKSLNMDLDKTIITLDKHANTSAASIPLALDAGIKTDKIKRGDLMLLSAFGAGLTWGGALIRY